MYYTLSSNVLKKLAPRNVVRECAHTVALSLYSEDATVEEEEEEEVTPDSSSVDNSFKTSSPSEFKSTEADRGNKTYHHKMSLDIIFLS